MSGVSFSAVSCATASRIAALSNVLYEHWPGATVGDIEFSADCRLCDVVAVVESVLAQASALSQCEEIKVAIDYFVVDACITALFNFEGGCSQPEFRSFYESVQEIFLGDRFESLTRGDFADDSLYNRFLAVRQHSYGEYCEMSSRRLVVSLTSYPARVGSVPAVLERIYAQTRPADEVVLYLAECQFPGGEGDLPEDLRTLAAEKKLTIRWCPVDLKPHKKYFYAFQDYPDDVVVTIDDDLLYEPKLLEDLYDSYLLHPRAISAARTHLMVMSEDGAFLSYSFWPQEVDGLLYEPSMQLFATGVGGILYPPHLLNLDILLDEEAVLTTCPLADDIWLKVAELMSDVPVVLARKRKALRFVPGTQDVSLYKTNVNQNGNDRQLQSVVSLMESRFGKGIVRDKFLQPIGVQLVERKDILEILKIADKKRKSEKDALNGQIKKLQAYKDVSATALARLTARIDVKNMGEAGNRIEIFEISDQSASVRAPDWFCDATGEGLVIESSAAFLDLSLLCVGSGKLQIKLKGKYVEDAEGERVPYWIDYSSFLVDGKPAFTGTRATWHDRPFTVTYLVEDGQVLTLSLTWHSHNARGLGASKEWASERKSLVVENARLKEQVKELSAAVEKQQTEVERLRAANS